MAKKMTIFLIPVFFLSWVAAIPKAQSAEKNLKVKIQFTYKNTDLKMQLYEVDPAFKFSVAKTVVTSNLKKSPLGKKIEGDLVFPRDTSEQSFALVVENNSESPKYFYAVPHTHDPGASSLGALFECLCNHHVYKVPPHQAWYRIVRLKIDQEESHIAKMDRLTISHQIVEVPPHIATKKYRTLLYEQEGDTP